jgi:acyl-CoA synthetase (AMP-forming)/AMP-acid ligase II/acyl carrier protein
MAELIPASTSIARLLQYQAGERPDAEALLAPGYTALSYRRLWEQIQKTVARLHECGLSRGDRIALVLPDGPSTVVAQIAVACFGVACPLNPAYRRAEFETLFADLRVKAVMVQLGGPTEAQEAARAAGLPVVELAIQPGSEAGVFDLSGNAGSQVFAGDWSERDWPEARDVAFILFSSGTTAKPKKIPLTHEHLLTSTCNKARLWGMVESDRNLILTPMFHTVALGSGTLVTWWRGATLIATPGFQAALFRQWLEAFRPTCYTAVPAQHQAILARMQEEGPPADCSLRWITSIAASLPPAVMQGLEQALGAPILEGYGSTETQHIFGNPGPPGVRKPGSVGRGIGPEARLVDDAGHPVAPGAVGEIVVRADQVFPGYEDDPEANQAAFIDGWFHTGDLGRLDEDGYLFLTGRTKEMINRGGENIAPREVEEVLLQHPAVADAACFAVPDPRLGEEIAAAVILRPGQHPSERDLRRFVAERKADFMVPARIHKVAELPKNASGKVQRDLLTERFAVVLSSGKVLGAHQEPHTPLEERLAAIWSQHLGVSQVGLHDSFLDAGGDSMLATRLLITVNREFHVQVPLMDFFDRPTIAGLATVILEAQAGTGPGADRTIDDLEQLSEEDAARLLAEDA